MDIGDEDGEKLNDMVSAAVTELYGEDRPFVLFVATGEGINAIVHHLTDKGVTGMCIDIAGHITKKEGMN